MIALVSSRWQGATDATARVINRDLFRFAAANSFEG
jgi:hypothetical protein